MGGIIDTLEENVNTYCGHVLDDFARKYGHLYPEWFVGNVEKEADYKGKIDLICTTARRLGHRLYLIVDEYDNFTNDVLAAYGEDTYHRLTHATGFYRDLFKKFKPNFDRILMLGVSPVTMDDLTSGYNIATAITMDPRFNMMLGFSEQEVRQMTGYYDFFLMPELDRYPMVQHSYILELKYLRQDATGAEAQTQWQDAVGQIRRYAQGRMVRLLQRTTQLHLIIAQVRGYTWERVEEIED